MARYRGQLSSINTAHMNLGWLAGICLGIVTPVQHYWLVYNILAVSAVSTL